MKKTFLVKKSVFSVFGVLGLLTLAACGVQQNSVSSGAALAPSYGTESAPAADQRRDLGTVWGENRSSNVNMVQFVRQDPSNPDASSMIYYNDKAAVNAVLANQTTRTVKDVTLTRGVTLSVLDKYDGRMPLRSTGDRFWLNGVDGDRYSLKLVNDSPRSYEAVVSVDGLSVLNGKAASYASEGYILRPNTTTVIDGFRTSQETVAAFRFGTAAQSYAASQGAQAAQNVGVIGVALFGERLETRSGADPFPAQPDPRFAQPPRR